MQMKDAVISPILLSPLILMPQRLAHAETTKREMLCDVMDKLSEIADAIPAER